MIARTFGLLVTLAFVPACGATTTGSPAPIDVPSQDIAASDIAADIAQPPDDAADASVNADVPYPAVRPPVPVVTTNGGLVLAAPHVVPVFLAAGDGGTYPFEDELMGFLTRYMASPEWRAQVAEYGVSAGTVASAVHTDGAGLPAGAVTGVQLQMWAQAQVRARRWGNPTGAEVYVLFLDAGRVVNLATSVLCSGVGGYHEAVVDSSNRPEAIAVIPNCRGSIDVLTRTTSHELVEAATDPYVGRESAYSHPSNTTPPDGAWAVALNGGEVGDLCERRGDAAYIPVDVGHTIQRTWSNAAAIAYRDPCVPSPAGEVYFNSVPVLPETIQITNRAGSRPVSARGVTLTPLVPMTIDVQLFSTGPTSAPWRVVAQEVRPNGEPMALRFMWDRSTGRNGDVLRLTITAIHSVPDGRTFVLSSTLGTENTTWVGAVVTH